MSNHNLYIKENYKLPKLQQRNLNAAELICVDLKEVKFLSNASFFEKLIEYRNDHYTHVHPKNFENIITFLHWHNMVTKETINGLTCWAATQKCFRAKPENWFNIKNEITLSQVNDALAYQKVNNGKVPFNIEANVIATNILCLKGEIKKEFMDRFIGRMEMIAMDDMMINMGEGLLEAINTTNNIVRK